jgi:transglutaminase-like putative cysteine protease
MSQQPSRLHFPTRVALAGGRRLPPPARLRPALCGPLAALLPLGLSALLALGAPPAAAAAPPIPGQGLLAAAGSAPAAAPVSAPDGRRPRHGAPQPGAGGGSGSRFSSASSSESTSPGAATGAAGSRGSRQPDDAGVRPEPWEAGPFAADPAAVARAAARFEGHDGEPVVVLLSDQRYTLDAAGRETYTQRLVYRILTAAADSSWSTVERSWAPWHQARPEVRARVITPEGVAHPLDLSVLTESGEMQDAPDMFGDGRVLRGPLPATGPGAVVEQEVTVRDTAPFFDAGTVEVADVAASVSMHHARVVLEAPAAAPLRWVTRLLPPLADDAPRDETLAGAPPIRRLTFDYRELPAQTAGDEAEPGLPPELARSPYVAFSTGRSWADVARRYSAVVDEALRGADLQPLIRAAGGPGPSQVETMNRLLTRLGEIRYTGVELGQGGIVPRTPAETLRRKFGDCKDKAVLLVAALRALDIPAYAALLNAGEDQQDVEEGLPGFGAFNHAIVVVPGSPSVWIDPTDRFARAGELPADDQGRLALIASPTATGLTRTPEADAAENRAVKVREFFLADQGAARVVENDEYWGAAERDLRAFYTAEEPDALREALSDYMRRAYLAKDLTTWDHANPLDLSRPFHLRLETRETKRAVTDEKGAAVAILPSALLDQLPDELTTGQDRDKPGKPRVSDYYFSRPFTAEGIYRIVPPPGFAPQPLPANRVRRLGPATLSEEYAAGGDGVVTAKLRLESGKRRISAAEFEQLRASVREIAAAKPILVQFSQLGEADLAAGRVREAIAEFQREAVAAPKKALPRCRLARALLAGGLGEAARQEAERAIRLEPRSATAQRTLGWVLQHDVLGRRFGAGFDRAGAIAAYRRAKDLDPDGEATRADLAILLEHDVRGRRYAAGADLAAAISEYLGLRTDLKSKAMDDNLLIVLLRAGRFTEMQALAAELEDSPARDALRLAATAATAGPETAVRDAERRAGDPASLVAALDAAAEELVALRRYGEAAALLGRAARQSPNAAAYLTRADALRRARRHEETPLAAGDPAAAAKRFLLAAVADPPATERMLGLLSHGLAAALSPAARRELVEAPGRGLHESPREAELAADVRQDLVLAAWRTSVRGDDSLGYRVEITSTVGESAGRSALYVVPENGEYRIAALADAPATLGLEALRRLAAHDLRGARQWLDWASEELRLSPPAALAGSSAAGGAEDELPTSPLLALWGHAGANPAKTEPAGTAAAEAEAAATGAEASAAGVPETPNPLPAAGAAKLRSAPPARPAGSASLATPEIVEPRCAAASLAAAAAGGAAGSGAEAILAILRACRDAAASAAPRRLALEAALADAYGSLARFPELLDTAGRLAAARPDSGVAFALQARALAGLARWPELEELARRRLRLQPDDAMALRLAARAASRRADLETTAALLRRIVDSGRETAGDLNELAWLALVRGRPDDQAVEDAQRAAALSGYREAAALHTLASLYAEQGRPAEAYRIIVQSIEARPASGSAAAAEPVAADWFVFGHLAESYGLPDVARRLYARVRPGKPEEPDPLSTFRLAQARLAALGTVKEAAAAKSDR